MSKALKEIDQFKRDKLKELLGQCTEKQQAFFKRCHPYPSIDEMEMERVNGAIMLCERTIAKNEKDLNNARFNK